MIYYLLLPIFSLFLLVIQVTVVDILSFGKVGLEISLILVVYAGLHLSVIRGVVLSLIIGFFLDCLTGVIPGVYLLSYVLIFLVSKAVSPKVYTGKVTFIIAFTFICALFGELFIALMYEVLCSINIFPDVLGVSFFQATVTGVFAPAFFVLFYRLEVLLNVWESRSPDRL
ncbi:MAG: hypothetical protein U9N38_00340 [Thermodesulfobacteriota bacterium]|nr:hypothetical protein [Thermodesulfobacteriota bacterium]